MTAEKITAYKGFDLQLRCRDHQFEVGKTYTHDGPVVACKSGYHACEHPLDVLAYYAPGHSRYAIVTQGGNLARHDDDSKIASSVIAIKAELTIRGLVAAAIEYTFARTPKKVNKSTTTPKGGCATSGDGANSATSGYRAHSATSGDGAHSATSGDGAHSATSGYRAHSATSGYGAHSATSGDRANSATSGYGAHSATSGDGAHSATSGDGAHSATSGHRAHSATSGAGAHSATSGYRAHSATSGDGANSATSGDRANSATSGDRANSATSGYGARAEASGAHAVAANAGNGPARAGESGAIFLVERNGRDEIVAVFASKVGENGIKANTWYGLQDGKPMEVTP